MNQPLRGRKILVTRARHQASQLSEKLAALGAEVIEIPLIEIIPPQSYEPLDEALRNVSQYQLLILTSGNAAKVLAGRMAVLGLNPEPFAGLQVAAIGSSTARALGEIGLSVHVTPQEYVAESLLAALGKDLSRRRVLIIRAAAARDVIPAGLIAAGAQVEVIDAYRTMLPESSLQQMRDLLANEQSMPEAATFTSSSTVDHFFELLAACTEASAKLWPVKAVSIGPITSASLRRYGREPAAEADPHDLDGLVAAVVRSFQ